MNDDEDGSDEEIEEKYDHFDDLDEIEEADVENLDPNTSTSSTQYSLTDEIQSNKRKRVEAMSKKQPPTAKQPSMNKNRFK